MARKVFFFIAVLLLFLSLLSFLYQGITGLVIKTAKTEKPLAYSSPELLSPADRITEKQIEIRKDRIIIHINDSQLSRYGNTNSMDPLLDEDSNGIEIVPKREDDIKVGDIVTYEQDGLLIVHRVIEIGEDEYGKYFIVKGDNNKEADAKIRFNQIRYITIGILY
jgi:hypothetical protein